MDPGKARELVKASKALGWASLYPTLTAMARRTCFGCRGTLRRGGVNAEGGLSVLHMVEAFEALDLLLGEAPLTLLPTRNDFPLMRCMPI